MPAVRPALSVAPESQSRREGSSWPQESLQTHLLPIGNDLVHTKMHKTVHNAMWISLYLEALFWESPKKLWYCQVSSLTGEKLCTFSFVAEAEESVPFIKQCCVTIIQKEGSTITYNIIWVKWHKRYIPQIFVCYRDKVLVTDTFYGWKFYGAALATWKSHCSTWALGWFPIIIIKIKEKFIKWAWQYQLTTTPTH